MFPELLRHRWRNSGDQHLFLCTVFLSGLSTLSISLCRCISHVLGSQGRLFISFTRFAWEPEIRALNLRKHLWDWGQARDFCRLLAPPWVNQLSSKQNYYTCHLVPLLRPRWIWDISLRLWNADTDGWQRLIQLQLGQNKQLFEMKMKLVVEREEGFLACCSDTFSFLNERGRRQVIQKCLWQ